MAANTVTFNTELRYKLLYYTISWEFTNYCASDPITRDGSQDRENNIVRWEVLWAGLGGDNLVGIFVHHFKPSRSPRNLLKFKQQGLLKYTTLKFSPNKLSF